MSFLCVLAVFAETSARERRRSSPINGSLAEISRSTFAYLIDPGTTCIMLLVITGVGLSSTSHPLAACMGRPVSHVSSVCMNLFMVRCSLLVMGNNHVVVHRRKEWDSARIY